MSEQKPLSLQDGKVAQVDSINDELPCELVLYSGLSLIDTGKTYLVKENRQTITFIHLTLDGQINLEGDYWLA